MGSNPTSGILFVPVAKWTRRRFPEPKTVGSSPIWDDGFFHPLCTFLVHSVRISGLWLGREINDSCSLEAEHRSYEPGVAGSIPARSILGACSVMVIIDASQALDPGSIPGRRTYKPYVFSFCTKKPFLLSPLQTSHPAIWSLHYVRPCSSVGRASD